MTNFKFVVFFSLVAIMNICELNYFESNVSEWEPVKTQPSTGPRLIFHPRLTCTSYCITGSQTTCKLCNYEGQLRSLIGALIDHLYTIFNIPLSVQVRLTFYWIFLLLVALNLKISLLKQSEIYLGLVQLNSCQWSLLSSPILQNYNYFFSAKA